MKKNLLFLTLITSAIALVGCKTSHEHDTGDWVYDDNNHWHECSKCNDLVDEGEHSYGEWSTKKEPSSTEEGLKERLCTVCGYIDEEKIEKLDHDHILSSWVNDDSNHWKTCSKCDNLFEKGNHTWDEGKESVIATTSEGKIVYTCTICGKEKEESTLAYSQVGSLVPKSWNAYEAFTLYARRNSSSISIRLVSNNTVFTSEGRDSKVEVYFMTGGKYLTRDGNPGVTRFTINSNKQLSGYNYSSGNINTSSIKVSVKGSTNTIIDFSVPYSIIGASMEDIFGINFGLWSETDNDWAPMKALNTNVQTNVEDLASYVRCDKNNQYFESPINDYKENVPTPLYNKQELINGYPYGIADPYRVFDESADDIYLKTSRVDDGFVFDMVGFGTFADNEHIKLIIHSPVVNGENWAIQEEDVSFLISKNTAVKKTGTTDFWDFVDFSEDDSYTINAPIFVENPKGYFTLSFKVNFTEIPSYSINNEYSFIALEFNDGNIYNGSPMDSAMTHNGVGVGDPAHQYSYVTLQERHISVDVDSLIAPYENQFSSKYYSNVTKEEDKIKIEILSFKPLYEDSFIRFVVDTDGVASDSVWELDTSDVSFTIYEDKAYVSVGQTDFWTNEENDFHSGDETIYAPIYENHGEYWTLTLEIQYDELGSGISQSSALKGLLVAFTPKIQNHGFNFNGTVPVDIAYQSNYFIL